MDWQTTELMGYAHYARKGYRVLVPVVRNDHYDFVAEGHNEFVRVNVKTAGLKDKSQADSWSISHASGGYEGSRDAVTCDVYLTWLPDQKRFIEIPGSFLVGGNSKSKRIPKEYLS